MIDLTKAKDPSEWIETRMAIEAAVLRVLQKIPKKRSELQVKTIDEMPFPGYVRRRINYFVEDWERVTAWLFIPDGRDEVPGILCCHSAVPQGKDEPAGLDGDPLLAFAHRYAERGYATLAADCITAGDRISHGLAPYDTTNFYADHPDMSVMGKMLSDNIHAVDALCDSKRVDPARVGVIGHGLGAQNALFLAAFDERIQACVASSGFTRFEDDKRPERWAGDEGFVYMPKLAEAVKQRKFEFDWEHILALIAPSPTLLYTALNDPEFDNTESCKKAVKRAANVYTLLGAADALENICHHNKSRVTQEILETADDWFERWL